MTAQIIGYLLSAGILIFTFAYRRRLNALSIGAKDARWIVGAVAFVPIAIGLYVRLFRLNTIGGGNYMFEELGVNLGTPYDFLYHVTTSHSPFSVVLAFTGWQNLFGPSLISGRALAGAFGLAGLVFLYLALQRLTDRYTAWIATALTCMSFYGSFFSRQALETGWPLPLLALNLWLYACAIESRKPALYILGTALCVTFGVFGYAGYTVWLLALTPPVLWQLFRAKEIPWRPLLQLGLELAVLFTGMWFLNSVLCDRPPSFHGGGQFVGSLSTYLTVVLVNLHDLFVHADSFLLIGSGFVESAWIGFFIIGCWRLVVKERQVWAKVLLDSFFLIPLAASIGGGQFPGMRRGIAILGIFYIFSGSGLATFLGLVMNLRLFARAGGLALVTTAIVISAQVLFQGIKQSDTDPLGITDLLQLQHFNEWVENPGLTVVLAEDSGYSRLMAHYFEVYGALHMRFIGKSSPILKSVTPLNGVFPIVLDPGEKRLFLIESSRVLDLIKSKFCVSNEQSINKFAGIIFLATVERCR